MTIQELKKKAYKIDKLVEEKIISDNEKVKPIKDGIIDINKYYSAKYKILWILKEPYDYFDEDGNPEGGDYDLKKALAEKKSYDEFTDGKPTFMPIIYTSWGILNNFCLWEKMPYVEYDPSVLNAIQSSAYINIKKIPGRTSSPESVIKEAYLIHNDILHKQIEYYDPDIIIGGSTLHHFFQNLGFTGEQMERNGSNNYIIKDEKIFIDAYHPAQRPGTTGVSKESYCNDIITAVKNWSSN